VRRNERQPERTEQPAAAAPIDYNRRVTVSLLADVLATFEARHPCADGEPLRLARALETICRLADALAGPAL